MIFVTKHIKASDTDRKERLQQLQQKESISITHKLDELKVIAEQLQEKRQTEKSNDRDLFGLKVEKGKDNKVMDKDKSISFERSPITAGINSFMNSLISDDEVDSEEDEFYRDFYGRNRQRTTGKRDINGCRVKGA